jgi:hypothetical protein
LTSDDNHPKWFLKNKVAVVGLIAFVVLPPSAGIFIMIV